MGKTRGNPETSKKIGARIREARLSAGLSQDGLAQLVGVTRAAVSLWEDTGELKVQNLALAASVMRVDLNWLVTGKGESAVKSNGSSPPNAKGVLVEIKGGLGAAGPAHAHTMADWWRVNPSALKSIGGHVDSVKIYRVDTDVMAPTINPGSYVLIDFAQTTIRDGQVYAIDTGIALTMRRIRKPDAKNVQLCADNARERSTTLPMKNVAVAGRLIAQLLAPL